MKYIYILIVILFASGAKAQDYNIMHVPRDTPQANLLNPAYLPESSFLTIPVLGATAFRVTNSFSLYDIIDNRTLHLPKVPDGSELNLGFNLNFVNIGLYIDDETMITFSAGIKTNIDFMYPTGSFDLIVDNPNGNVDSFDVNFKNTTTLWGEIAVGYTRALNNNWSVGVKLKYLMGAIGGTTSNSEFKVNRTISAYTVQGDIDIRIGGYDTNRNIVATEEMISNVGWATDLGVYYKSDDNRYRGGVSILDLGYIKWDNGAHIVSRNPNQTYVFSGFGNVSNGGNLTSFSNSVYANIIDVIEVDTMKMSFRKMLPTTIHLGGSYNIDPVGQHIVTATLINRIYGSSGHDYSLEIGYAYSPKSKRYRLMSSLTNRKYEPLSIGLGIMRTSESFQLYIMSDASINSIFDFGDQRGIGLNIGMNVLLGEGWF